MRRQANPHAPIVYGVTIPLSARAFLRGQLNLVASKRRGVHLVYGSDGEGPIDEIDSRITQTTLPVRRDPAPIQDVRGLVGLVKYLWELRPGIVVMGTPKMGLLGTLAAWLCRVPRRVYILHGLRLEGATGLGRVVLWCMEWLSMACATEVIAVSRSNREQSLKMRLTNKDKILVLGAGGIGGVDVERFTPPGALARAAARERFDLPLDGPVVGFVGRLTRDKGLSEMAQVWSRVHAEFPDAWLLLVGPNETGSLGLEHLVAELTALPRVRVHGPVRDPEMAYAAMDLLLLLTRREGFGMVLVEAGACGIPAVATAVGGTVDAVSAGVTGTLVPSRDVEAAAAAVRAYLRDPELRALHGRAAHERVVEDFASDRVNGMWVRHLTEGTANQQESQP